MRRILVLGGSASGKSGFAESLLADEPAVEYVATAFDTGEDAEWSERIAAHQKRRPAHWRTNESSDLAEILGCSGPAVLIDSVTTWAAASLDSDVDERIDALCAAWAATQRRVVAVSDEVGSGVVPASADGRRFRDLLGGLNQRLAAVADDVHLVVAGLPVRLK